MYQQQESSSQDTFRDEQKSPYGAYEGFSSTHDEADSTYGQKLNTGIPAASKGPPWEYRLGLLITSLVLWMGFFFAVIGLIDHFSATGTIAVDLLLITGLVVFTIMMFGANLLFFYRKR